MSLENIEQLEAKACAVFTEIGYSKHTITQMLNVAKALTKFHIAKGESQFTDEIATEYIQLQENRCKNGEIGNKFTYQCSNTIRHLKNIYEKGTTNSVRRKSLQPLPINYEKILSAILSNEEWTPKSRKCQRDISDTFFRWLCSKGISSIVDVDHNVVHDYLTFCSSRMNGSSLNSTRKAIKKLLLFLSDNNSLSEQMNRLFLFRIPINKKLLPYMPQNEIADVLNVINRNTTMGARDYAIILLATVTGLRSIDIMELTLGSIDWRNGEIIITQKKTGKALALPLTVDVGEAIRSYLKMRPSYNNPSIVFLSNNAPHGPLRSNSTDAILKKYCVKANVSKRWNFHSLRRSLATNMVTSGVSIVTVAQSLGQACIESTTPYISLDTKHLKECALDFRGIQVGGDIK